MTSKLTPQQYSMLLAPLKKQRVGKNDKGHAHMEAWDIRRHLTRIFGFGGWSEEILTCELVQQIDIAPTTPAGRTRYTVVYRATLRLTVRYTDGTVMAVFEDGACGDSSNQPKLGDAHDNAMKTALSQALKRCAVNLGDQFGLSLYDGESLDPVMVATLNPPAEEAAAPELPTAEVKPEPDAKDMHQELPAPPPPPPVPMVNQKQHNHMHALWGELGYAGDANRDQRLGIVGKILGVPKPETTKTLTEEEADRVIAKLRQVAADKKKEAGK